MALRDLVHKTLVKGSLVPAVRVNGSVNGTAVDLRGFDAAAVSVAFGAYTDGTHTPALQHSADGTSFVAVPAGEMDGAFAAVSSAAGANSVQTVGYKGAMRFLRVAMSVTGATSGAASAAFVVLGEPHRAPCA